MLEVAIHHDEDIRISMIQSRLDGVLMPEIPRQLQGPDAVVHTGQVLDALQRVIRTAVIDKEDRELVAGALQRLADLFMNGPDVPGFVMGGQQYLDRHGFDEFSGDDRTEVPR